MSESQTPTTPSTPPAAPTGTAAKLATTPPPADRGAKPLEMGVYGRHDSDKWISSTEVVALVLSLLWLIAVSYFFLVLDPSPQQEGPVSFVMTLMAVFLPVALIWVAASAARTARTMRQESARLQAAIDAMRHAYVEQQQMAGMSIRRTMEDKIDRISKAQERSDAALAGLSTPQPTPRSEQAPASRADVVSKLGKAKPEEQPGLALGTPAEDIAPTPLTADEFIKALNFPENEKDKEGFRVLRLAMNNRDTSRLIAAAQDVLTLLSHEGIYMDDLLPDRAKPDVWRKFAAGERGRAIADLGGIRDRSSLALSAGRMRSDPVFKDAVHHFLRQFDKTVAPWADNASDVEITKLANTRTARAFMLLGRVTGTFD